MRKLISLLLCVALCFILVGCAEEDIGADLDDYLNNYQPEVREEITLDFYIVVEDTTVVESTTHIKSAISSYLQQNYKTELNINFLKASEYEDAVSAGISNTGERRADIILVNSAEMFNSLYEDGSLIQLNGYLASSDFGILKPSISSELLAATSVVEKNKDGADYNAHYVLPNNRVVGTYDYIMVNNAIASLVNISLDMRNAMTSMESPELIAFLGEVEAYRDGIVEAGLDPDKAIVYIEDASYVDREWYLENGYQCNIASYPEVSAEEAHESSFAIVKQPGETGTVGTYVHDSHYIRCMEVLFALNTDPYLRNLLQYGVEIIDYQVSEDGYVTRVSSEERAPYKMNLIYTGNMFNAFYCEADNWNESLKAAYTKHLQDLDNNLNDQ